MEVRTQSKFVNYQLRSMRVCPIGTVVKRRKMLKVTRVSSDVIWNVSSNWMNSSEIVMWCGEFAKVLGASLNTIYVQGTI